jgi:hypothetical protein
MRVKARVQPGICGFDAEVTADVEDFTGNAVVEIKTECPNLKKLGERFEIGVMEYIRKGCASESFAAMAKAMPAMHCPCAVMNAVFGAVKIAGGLALPKDIHVAFEKEG